MKILVVGSTATSEFGAYIYIKDELRRLGHDCLMFKQDTCLDPGGDLISFSASNDSFVYLLRIDGTYYDAETFDVIYYLHPVLPKPLRKYADKNLRYFIQKQFLSLRQSLWHVYSHKKWLNDLEACYKAENKVYQFKLAREVGFEIPDTLVSTDPEKVKSFYQKHAGNIIAKILEVAPIQGTVFYTGEVTEEMYQNIESVQLCPNIFQEKIEKSYELRITVVGDKVFPVKIYSQEGDPEVAIDWRKKPLLNDYQVKMEATQIDSAIEKKILLLMKKLNLTYGAFDFIIKPDGTYIYLEVNPSGQWYFVQNRTNVAIAKAIAELLVA